MKNIAVICEFNPFHKGHEYLLSTIKKAHPQARILCLMSGNFVQRGEPAIANKYLRAKIAVLSGADLVLELPLPFSISNAEGFAFGAISILNQLSGVDALYFGSECGEVAPLMNCAKKLSSEKTKEEILALIKNDRSLTYPQGVKKVLQNEECLNGPNDVLGIEYIKALIESKSAIQAFAVKRVGCAHDSGNASGDYASASFLRNELIHGSFENVNRMLTSSGAENLAKEMQRKELPVGFHNAQTLVLGALREKEKLSDRVKQNSFVRYLINEAKECVTLEDLYTRLKSKHFTLAYIRRQVLACYLGISLENDYPKADYTTVLALNKKGSDFLQEIRKTSKITILTKAAKVQEFSQTSKLAALNLAADKKYTLFYPVPKGESSVFQTSPYYNKEG